MNKKIISFVTAFFMIFTLFDFPASVHAELINGCTIDGDTLTRYSSYSGGSNAVVPDGVKHIADIAFVNDSRVESVTLPEGIETIGEDAFSGCSNMTSINLPDSITSIGAGAFSYCTSLTAEITIPAGVTAIEPFVFDNCGAPNIIIHSNVESIGEYSFRQCRGLTSLHIPDSVKTIGAYAFSGCGNLQTVNIPNGIETIEGGTFQWCGKLSSIEIPDSVKAIGNHAFNSCEALTSITIPDSVEEIGDDVFFGCTGLTSINIPNSVTAIGSEAFYGCTGLTSINIPSSVTSIGSMAFYNCYYLDMITYPKELDVSNAWFPAAATKVEYTVENGEVTITDIILGAGTGKTEVEIPEAINGVPVTSVNESVRDKVSPTGHVHRIEKRADCTSGDVCSICGEINEPLRHSFENGECTVCGAKDPDYSQPTETTPDDTEPPVTNPSDTEPPVTAPPVTDPSDTEPPVTAPTETYPAATAPSNGYPLVIPYGYTTSSNEKMFEALAGASDGDTIVIDLNGNTDIDKSVFDEIKGRDVTVRFRLKGGAYWTVNGKDIEHSRKVDLGVRMNRMSASRDEIKELAGDKKTVKFTLRHNGKLGFNGILNVPINKKYNGKYANLYYYSNGFEFIAGSLISDGYAQFRFDHASEYIIVIDDYPHGEDVSAAAGAQCDDTPIDGAGNADSEKNQMYFTDKRKFNIRNRKRRYRILKIER